VHRHTGDRTGHFEKVTAMANWICLLYLLFSFSILFPLCVFDNTFDFLHVLIFFVFPRVTLIEDG
jgi:hypothetical protein